MDFKEYSIGEFDTEEQKKFRQEVREWIDKNMDPRLSHHGRRARVTA